MGKIVSNSDIISIFVEIDEIKESLIDKKKINKIVREKQNKIVEDLSFLVYNKTKQYMSFPNYEDLVQEGFVGLVKAVQKFKHNMFPNFFVYANQWINHYIKRAASKFDVVYDPNKTRVVYSEPSEEDVDPGPGPDEILFKKECKEKIKKALDSFAYREREVINDIFGLEGDYKTLRDIGPRFDLTHERIRQIKNNVLDKLRKNKEIDELNTDL